MRRASEFLVLLSLGACAPAPALDPVPSTQPDSQPVADPTMYFVHGRLRSVPSSALACERGKLPGNAALRLQLEARTAIPEDYFPSEFHEVYLPCQVLRDLQRADEQLLVERRCFGFLVAEPVAISVDEWSREPEADRDLVRMDAGPLGELHTRDGISDARTWVVHDLRKASCRDFRGPRDGG